MAKVDLTNCEQCGAPLDLTVENCKFCGADISYVISQTNITKKEKAPKENVAPKPQRPQKPIPYDAYQPTDERPGRIEFKLNKDKVAAGFLAIFLGSFGIHKFYLGKTLQGVLYLLFCWTYIPLLLGLIDGIVLFVTPKEKFIQKYGKPYVV